MFSKIFFALDGGNKAVPNAKSMTSVKASKLSVVVFHRWGNKSPLRLDCYDLTSGLHCNA
jgi:hypothetical protein